jgi:hypothetical protein
MRSGRDLGFRRVRARVLVDAPGQVEVRRIDLRPAVSGGAAEERGAAHVLDVRRRRARGEPMRDLDDLPLAIAEYQ